MKKTLTKIGMLLTAMGIAASGQAFGGEETEPVFRPPLIKQVSAQQTVPAAKPAPEPPQEVPTSRWETQEPIQTPEQPTGPVAAGCGQYAVGDLCCAPGCQFIVGIEATFFWPQFSRDFLSTTLTNTLGSQTYVDNASLGSVEGNLLVGPRITLGVQGDCWGLVGRYWNSAANGNNFSPALPDAVQSGILLFDQFNVYTADLEVQRRFCWRNWDMFGFGGVRYASVNNDRNLWVNNTFDDDLVQGQSFSSQQFNGAGLTFGVFGLRPLFCDDGALKAYFSNRYSVLWGNGVAAVQTQAQALTSGGAFESIDGAIAGGDGDMFIFEIGAGLQWETCLCCLPGRAFFRCGFEWQYWDANAGVNVASTSFAAEGTAAALSTATADDLLFDLVGFTIGAGLTY